ncbi:MAG: hypothetical protein KDK90_07370, partial [Leptospiraceae bacterium]|nr:hypothetical protein [Leptospiraceae bacterium]
NSSGAKSTNMELILMYKFNIKYKSYPVQEEFVAISVKDTGVGIDQEKIGKLFNIGGIVATKGTDEEKGTGLGLFICKEFVEKNGGKIEVESELGKGSTFTVVLPKA